MPNLMILPPTSRLMDPLARPLLPAPATPHSALLGDGGNYHCCHVAALLIIAAGATSMSAAICEGLPYLQSLH
jgi:hypothetical protein